MNPKARRADIYTEKLNHETVIYDKANHRAHCLNATTAFVWENADGSRTAEELAGLLEAKLGIPKNAAALSLSLEQLSVAGLMEDGFSAPEPAANVLSRREVARKFRDAWLAVSLFPLVASVVAPTPAMAASAASHSDRSVFHYEKDLNRVNTDIAHHFESYGDNASAQKDYWRGIGEGDKGLQAASDGHVDVAKADFKSARSDFDGVLRDLGLGPL